jgi:hypothetical protein
MGRRRLSSLLLSFLPHIIPLFPFFLPSYILCYSHFSSSFSLLFSLSSPSLLFNTYNLFPLFCLCLSLEYTSSYFPTFRASFFPLTISIAFPLYAFLIFFYSLTLLLSNLLLFSFCSSLTFFYSLCCSSLTSFFSPSLLLSNLLLFLLTPPL